MLYKYLILKIIENIHVLSLHVRTVIHFHWDQITYMLYSILETSTYTKRNIVYKLY